MEAADPLLLLVSLPLIPVGLVLGKMIKWQDPIIKVENNISSRCVYLTHLPLQLSGSNFTSPEKSQFFRFDIFKFILCYFQVLRLYLPRVPLTCYFLPAFANVPLREGSGAAASIPPSTDPVSVTRTFCAALFFPTIATFLGWYFDLILCSCIHLSYTNSQFAMMFSFYFKTHKRGGISISMPSKISLGFLTLF